MTDGEIREESGVERNVCMLQSVWGCVKCAKHDGSKRNGRQRSMRRRNDSANTKEKGKSMVQLVVYYGLMRCVGVWAVHLILHHLRLHMRIDVRLIAVLLGIVVLRIRLVCQRFCGTLSRLQLHILVDTGN